MSAPELVFASSETDQQPITGRPKYVLNPALVFPTRGTKHGCRGQLRGWVGPTSWPRITPCGQTRSGQLGLEISRRLSDIFKEGSGEWGKGNRRGGGTFGARGGGGVLKEWRVSDRLPPHKDNSFRLDRSSPQLKDSQNKVIILESDRTFEYPEIH